MVHSCALDAGGITARCGEMDMQVGRARIGKQPLNRAFQLFPTDQLGPDHHGIGVESAYREHALAQLLRHFVDGVECLVAFADENGKAHPVGRADSVVLIVDQDQLVAGI